MKIKTGLAGVVATAAFLALSTNAALIAEYNFNNTDLTESASASVAGVSASSVLTIGAGLNEYYSGDGMRLGGNRSNFGFGGSATLANALSANNYLSFTVTPDAGKKLDFVSLTWFQQSNSNNGLNEWALFTDNLAFTAGNEINSGSVLDNSVGNPVSVDLTGLADATAVTEFRVYLYGAAGGSSASASITDAYQLNANVIPEPATFGLLVAFGGGILFLRRRFNS